MKLKRWLFSLLVVLAAGTVFAQEAPEAISLALQDLGERVGQTVALENLSNWTWSEEVYSDASLGCPQPDQAYADVVTRGYRFVLSYGGTVYDYRVSTDGSIVFLCEDANLTATEAVTGEAPQSTALPLATIQPTTAATEAATAEAPIILTSEATETVTSDAMTAEATAGGTGAALTVEDAADVVELASVEGDFVGVMEWSPSGETIALGGTADAGTPTTHTSGVLFYNPAALDEEPRETALEQPVTALTYAATDPIVYLITGSVQGEIGLFPAEPEALDILLMETPEEAQAVNSIAVNPALTVIAAASGSVSAPEGESDNAVYLYDATNGAALDTIDHDAPVGAVAFSPNGALLAYGDANGTVTLWDVEAGEAAGTLEGGHDDLIRDLAFSPDGALLASGGMDGRAILWDVESSTAAALLESDGDDVVLSVAFSPDGVLLATAGGSPNAENAENAVHLWDVATGELAATLTGHTATVGSVAFSPSGDRLASASDDGTLRMWGTE